MENKESILIVDDDEDYCTLLSRTISGLGYHTYWTTKPSEVVSLIEKLKPVCLLLDMVFPQGDGMSLLKKVKKFRKDLPVIMLTGQESIKTAVETIKAGAFDYLTKPLNSEDFKRILTRIARKNRVQQEVHHIEKNLEKVESFEDLVHLSQNIQEFIKIELKANPEEISELPVEPSGDSSIKIPRYVSLREASGLATQQIEKRWILDALNQSHWRRSKAAEILGIDAKTLYMKIRAYGINSPSSATE